MRTLTLCRMLGSSVLLCVGTGVGHRLSAQSSELRLGDVARVSATTPRLRGLVGRVVALTADTLTLQTDDPVARIAISRAALISTERRLRTASRGKDMFVAAALGLFAGAAIGGIAAAVGSKPCSAHSDGFCGRGVAVAFGTIGGGALGLIAGTAIGLCLPVERWSPVKNLRLSLIPTGAVTSQELLVGLRY